MIRNLILLFVGFFGLTMPALADQTSTQNCPPEEALAFLEGEDPVAGLLLPEAGITIGEIFAVDIVFCASETPETLQLDAFMPAHGHGMPVVPERQPDADKGKATFDGLMLQMPGEWEFRLTYPDGAEQITSTAQFRLKP